MKKEPLNPKHAQVISNKYKVDFYLNDTVAEIKSHLLSLNLPVSGSRRTISIRLYDAVFNTMSVETVIEEINIKWRLEDSNSYNYHRKIIGYDLSRPMLLNLIFIQKEYSYKKSAINYIRKNKLTNWLLQETRYSNSTKKYTILGVY